MTMCPVCGPSHFVYAVEQPLPFFGISPGIGFGALIMSDRERQAQPRVRCPRGCEPWPWDLERLAADAVRLQQGEVAK